MRKIMIGSFGITFLALFLASASFAQENPNGFPSGDHYNLNIIGKKDGFACPSVLCDPLDLTCVPNVIYIPAYNDPATDPVEILMVSGKKGSAKTAGITSLVVTDWCTRPFDSDAAEVQLPPNENGYRVYARALAKPTYNPNLAILGNSLSFVEDDSGNLLYYLGSFKKDCVVTPDAPECVYTRTKGRSVATNITPLFEFTGDVCYFNPTGYCDPLVDCPGTQLCCDQVNIGTELEPLLVYKNCTIKDPLLACTNIEVTAYCKDYSTDPQWVFNVGDLVGYLWSMDNNGLKLLQIRFYPN